MKVVLYARVSTDKCEDCGKKPRLHPAIGHRFKGQDPEVQLLELREWCAKEKHTIVAEYVDRGISGGQDRRPDLDRMLHAAEKGLLDFKAVVVWRIDRFGRSFYGTTENLKALLDLELNFISVQDHLDTSTGTGRFIAHLLICVAEYFRDVLKENTKAGMRKARKEGRRPGPKIDPKKGPSRWTRNRERHRVAELA